MLDFAIQVLKLKNSIQILKKLFVEYNVNHHIAVQIASVRFVSVDMYFVSMCLPCSNENVVQGKRAFAFGYEVNDIAIFQTVFSSGFRIEMYVASCNDDAFSDFYFAARTNEFQDAKGR